MCQIIRSKAGFYFIKECSPTCKSIPSKVSQEGMYITKFGSPRHYSCCLVLNGFNVIFQIGSTIIPHYVAYILREA